MKKIKTFIKNNKTEILVLLAILALGSFLRLYKISEYMTFLGDEGRDVVIVRKFLVYGDVFLIGPGTSIGNMYLGPLYYYMMAPALWLGGLSPVAPAVMIALLGVGTIAFVWYVAREWFSAKGGQGQIAGLVAAFLYAISPTVIIYSRSSWNPNIMPFFALLCVFALWRVINTRNLYWLPVLGVSYAFVLQSHYLGLLLMPTLGVLWLYGLYLFKKEKKTKRYLLFSLFGFLLFAFLMSPLLIFDSRYGWRNVDALKKFFLERQTTVSARPWNALPQLWPIWQEISARLVGGRNMVLGSWVALISIVGLIFVGKERKLVTGKILPFSILTIWLLVALLGLGLYKQEIYDHYYGFFFVVPFLLLGGIASLVIQKARIRGLWIVGTILVFVTYFNFLDNPLRYPPNNQLSRTKVVAEKIYEEARGEKFNLAVLAERNYDAAYLYFLEWWNAEVVKIDPQRYEETVKEYLFVVCELPREKCDPTHSGKTEIANFGWSKIEEEWDIAGVTLFKLGHNI